jgi:hypothetical protein
MYDGKVCGQYDDHNLMFAPENALEYFSVFVIYGCIDVH